MIAAIDIGNTNLTICTIDKEGEKSNLKTFKSDSFSSIPISFLKYIHRYIKTKTESILISSVVPLIGNMVNRSFIKEINIKPEFINYQTKLPIKVKIKNPESLGSDRICNAVAGYELFKRKENVIVVDSGTAITYDVVNNKGEFLGGLIIPGGSLMFKALNKSTGKLPLVSDSINYNNKSIGINTEEAISIGVHSVIRESFKGIIENVENSYKRKFQVIISGGGKEIYKNLNIKNIRFEKNIVLSGIYFIAKHNGYI